jgi:hypothetical protein
MDRSNNGTNNSTIKKREVFYISGFDPRGSGFYHKLYSEESQKQAQLTGTQIEVGKRKKTHNLYHSWQIKYQTDNQETHTNYNFLRWDDIVRKYWVKDNWQLFLRGIDCYKYYFKNLNLRKCWRYSWLPVATLFLPLIYIIFLLIVFVLAATAIFNILPQLFNIVNCIILFIATFAIGLRYSEKLKIFWLLRIYIFCSSSDRLEKGEVDQRMNQFAEILAERIQANESDEILIIGHSVGAMLLIPAVVRAVKLIPTADLSKVKLMTLGHSIPIISFLYNENHLNDEIKQLANSGLYLLDVAAPADGACFALTGPFAGICEQGNISLKLISPRFHKMFDPLKYKKMRIDKYRIHFQYLMAAEIPVEYDYFAITAGKKPLEKFFE